MGTFSKDLQKLVSPKFDENLLIELLQEIFHLNNVQIKDISFNSDCRKGDSYLSTVTKFTVKASGNDSNKEAKEIILPLISKALPTNLGRRITFRSLDFFADEVIFYNKVWKAMKEFQASKNPNLVFNNIPLCISALADGKHDYVTLEDLSDKSYVGATRSGSMDLIHAQLIMKLFAKFHAVGLAFKHQQPQKFEEVACSLKETYFLEKFRPWYENFLTKNLYTVVRDAVGKQLPESYVTKLNELFATDFYGTLICHCATRGPLAVITHGDAWAPNFLFKYDSDKVTPLDAMMIDFQLTRYASLALDILFFLYSCTEQSLRLEHWDTLIEDYHTTFVQTLESLGSPADLLTLDALKKEIKDCATFGIGMSMEAIVMSLLEDDETADLDNIPGEQGLPLEMVWIIHPFKSEEKRQRLADMIKHAIDNGFI